MQQMWNSVAKAVRRSTLRWVCGLPSAAVLSVCLADCGLDRSGTDRLPSSSVVRSDLSGEIVFVESGQASKAFIGEIALGTGDQRVRSGSGPAHVPALSPDGETLAWAGPSADDPTWPDVYVRNLGSTEVRRVGAGAFPRWTPDGEAFTVGRADGLYRLNLDGTAERIFDGQDMTGMMVGEAAFLVATVHSLSLRAEGRVHAIYEDEDCGPAGFDFDADSGAIVFAVRCERSGSAEGIFISGSAQSKPERLVAGRFAGVSWSPDGGMVAAAAATPGKGSRESELWVIDATSGALAARFGAGDRVQWPDWGVPR